jgi:hypothetical protein
LHKASNGTITDDEEYIEIFTDFPWGAEYGGFAWANIAKANIKLKQLDNYIKKNLQIKI